jgi:hypothetical protein
VVEEVTPLAKPDHVALYISAPGSATAPVKFLVSEATTYATLLDVVRLKFALDAAQTIDIAVVTPAGDVIGHLSESTIAPMATHKGMLHENVQFSYQVRVIDAKPPADSPSSTPTTPTTPTTTTTTPDDDELTPRSKKKKTRVKRPKASADPSPATSRNSSLTKKSSLQRDAVTNSAALLAAAAAVASPSSSSASAAAASSEPVPIGRSSRTHKDSPDDSKDASPSSSSPLAAHSSSPDRDPSFKLVTIFVPDSKAPRPTPHIIECMAHYRTGELLQHVVHGKRIDKKKVDGAWLFEVDELAAIDRRVGDAETVLDLVNAWEANGQMERKLVLKKDTAGHSSTVKSRMSFRNISDTLRRVGAKPDGDAAPAAASPLAAVSAPATPQSQPGSGKTSAASSPSSIFSKVVKARKSTDAQQPSPTDAMRKELEDANSQIEALELALAVANNKLMRLENQKMSDAVASQTAAAAFASSGLGRGVAGALSREALSQQSLMQLPRFAPSRSLADGSLLGAGGGAAPAGGGATAAAAAAAAPDSDTIGRVRLELTVNIPEFGLVGLVDNYWASPGDTVRTIIDRVMGRYGVSDPQNFGLRQLSGAADRWFDEKVVVAQSQSIMKNQLAAERRKGKPQKLSEDLATRIRALSEILGRKPHPSEVELVVPRSGGGTGAETFAGLPLLLPVVQRVCDTLERRALDSEGLFRVSGDHNRVRSLWAVLSSADAVSLESEAVNNIAGALKMYVRTSKPPLIPTESMSTLLHLQHVESARIIALNEAQPGVPVADDAALPGNISRALMHGMSAHDFAVLARLVALLSRVAARSSENKMTLSNLGVVFGPALVRTDDSNSVQAMRDAARYGNAAVCTMVHYCREIFGPFLPAAFATKPTEQLGTVSAEAAAAASASPADESSGLDAAMDLHLSAKSVGKAGGGGTDDDDDDEKDADDSGASDGDDNNDDDDANDEDEEEASANDASE